MAMTPIDNDLEALGIGQALSSAPQESRDSPLTQMALFRDATARMLEATHGWLNCLLSARPRPSPEIVSCTELALPIVTDIVSALSTAGWAMHFGSQAEAGDISRAMQRMWEVHGQVQACVQRLNVSLQVAGRCFTVM